MRETLARLAKQQSRPRDAATAGAPTPQESTTGGKGARTAAGSTSSPLRRPSPALPPKARPLGARESTRGVRAGSTASPGAVGRRSQTAAGTGSPAARVGGPRSVTASGAPGAAEGRLPTPLPPRTEPRNARPSPPPADVLDSDRILELPTNRSRTRQLASQRTQSDVRMGTQDERSGASVATRGPLPLTSARRTSAGGMQSIGDALEGYRTDAGGAAQAARERGRREPGCAGAWDRPFTVDGGGCLPDLWRRWLAAGRCAGW